MADAHDDTDDGGERNKNPTKRLIRFHFYKISLTINHIIV